MNGLELITPSSVAGSGVSLSGAKVTFTAAASISVNGVFDSTYDNYLLVSQLKGSGSGIGYFLRLRASGTDNSTASSYVDQGLFASNTSVTGARNTANLFDFFGAHGTSPGGFHCYLYGPALAQPTAKRNVMVSTYAGVYIADSAGTHNQSTSYDGFTLFQSIGNMTGTLTIYGLSQ